MTFRSLTSELKSLMSASGLEPYPVTNFVPFSSTPYEMKKTHSFFEDSAFQVPRKSPHMISDLYTSRNLENNFGKVLII